MRVSYLDSIRGLAAMQVLLCHSVSAFVPALYSLDPGTIGAAIHFSPAILLYDGITAVYVFFALSGLVLTFAFAGSHAPAQAQIPARIVRLLVPAVAAVLFSFAIVSLFHPETGIAGQILGTGWLARLLQPPTGVAYLLRDAFLNSIFLGYTGSGTLWLLHFGSFLNSAEQAYVAPLWSLSIELQGSVMILILTRLLGISKATWIVAMVASFLVFGRSHFLCFLIGHLLAVMIQRRGREVTFHWTVCAGFLIAGTWLYISEEMSPALLDQICTPSLPVFFPCTGHLQGCLGALCFFIALCTSKGARVALSHRFFQGLGRISFPLYLVHWPIVLGLGSTIFVALKPHVSMAIDQGLTLSIVIVISLAAAVCFVPVDRLSTFLSRSIRDAISPKAAVEPAGRQRVEA